VPPGTIRRIDLSDTLPEGVADAAITARTEGVPVVVSGAVLTTDEEPDATGLAIQLGASAADRSWVVSAGDPQDRSEWLRLVNPGADTASVDVVVVDGSAPSVAAELLDLEVPPGAVVQVELTEELEDLDAWTAFVTADTDIVVGRIGASTAEEGGLHLVAVPGQSAAAWTPAVRALAGSPEAGLLIRLHTSLGIPPPDPVDETGGRSARRPGRRSPTR
jgi:hypothetical protein